MYRVLVILAAHFICAQTRFLPAPTFNATTKNAELQNVVEETQHALCKISSADLQATANASITRQLKGVCTSSHLDSRISVLENTVILEINSLKNILENFLNPVQRPDLTNMQKSYSSVGKNNFKSHESQLTRSVSNKLESKSVKVDSKQNKFGNRDSEISNYNMTVAKGNSSVKFSYFWKIENVLDLLESANFIESGDFYFTGNHLYIKLHPNYQRTQQVLFQVIGLEEFRLSHKFTILDQENSKYDVSSPLIHCDVSSPKMVCPGFQIQRHILLSRNYIMNHNLIVKLTLYMKY